MTHSEVWELKKGDIFVEGYVRQNINLLNLIKNNSNTLYICVHTRRRDEQYYGYILRYDEYCNGIKWWREYEEMRKDKRITILSKMEVALLEL